MAEISMSLKQKKIFGDKTSTGGRGRSCVQNFHLASRFFRYGSQSCATELAKPKYNISPLNFLSLSPCYFCWNYIICWKSGQQTKVGDKMRSYLFSPEFNFILTYLPNILGKKCIHCFMLTFNTWQYSYLYLAFFKVDLYISCV